MSLSTDARATLADRQAALVAALSAGGGIPDGFDAAHLCAAAATLQRKRVRSAARAWPSLTRSLGPRFADLFADYARAAPLPLNGGPLADGRDFARWLADRGERLADAVRLQALAVDLQYTATPDGLIRRRWPAGRATWLHRSRRLVVAVCLPRRGVRWLSIPLGRRP